MTASPITFEQFQDEWLEDVLQGKLSTVEKGHRFAHKLITQWLDVEDDSEDLHYCDGAGDGGIDVAYLQRGDPTDADNDGTVEGHKWYLVQSKYGTAFQSVSTLLSESYKVIETLDGRRDNLSSLTAYVLVKINNFRAKASELDRIVLVFATPEALSEEEMRVLEDIRAFGRNRLGPAFSVEAVSIANIYQRTLEQELAAQEVAVPIQANVVPSGKDLLVGAVSLRSLYEFLKTYQKQKQDLDQIYEKNVRRFLGSRGRVNKVMRETLFNSPEKFGLYNNGITIVVNNFQKNPDGSYSLIDPYIVNGCQTTRTIWEVCDLQLNAGGTGHNPELERWEERLKEGVVVTKIVKVGSQGENLLLEITKYTNSQNAIREKDFLALRNDFKEWAHQMSDKHSIFLEIQRGAWDSQRAYQKQHPSIKPQFQLYANAFDLMKVYGAGWMGEAGLAFGQNSDFLPNGKIFREIMANAEEPFGVDDLYAAYRLKEAADAFNFGRGAPEQSRRQTRFLFYMVTIEMLRDVLIRGMGIESPKAKDYSSALNILFASSDKEAINILLDSSVQTVDEYLTRGASKSVFDEPEFAQRFNSDLNAFLKWEKLGKGDNTPCLSELIGDYQRLMGRGKPLPRQIIVNALKA